MRKNGNLWCSGVALALGVLPSALAWGLDVTTPRGTSVEKFTVPGRGESEICVVPEHLAFGKYSKKDFKAEKKLCKLNFYENSGTTDTTGAVAICAKSNSTSAAVRVYSFEDGGSKAALETPAACAAAAAHKKPDYEKEVAKFKQTDDDTTCTLTSSILAYYHVSRALGGIAQIAPAVIRTMDFDEHHKRIVLPALSNPKVLKNSLLKKSWGNFQKYTAGAASNPSSLFTADKLQIYGAMIKHEHHAGRYWITDHGSDKTSLPAVGAFRDVTNPAPASSLVGSREFNAANVQRLVAMRDMSEMILIDHLMQQNDRLSGSNISYSPQSIYKWNGEVKIVEDGDGIPGDAVKVTVKHVHLLDNDCGLIEGPGAIVKGGYLSKISHMHPETYARLMDFADKWEHDPKVQAFFRSEALFSDRNIASFGAGLLKARDALRARCKASRNFLDLDLNNYFSGKDVDPGAC